MRIPLAAGLRDSVSRFNFAEELEFTSIALAHYLPPVSSWINRFGERFDFDQVADRLMRQRGGACHNVHRLYAVAILLRAHEQHEIIRRTTVYRIQEFLKATAERLERHQSPDGLWDGRWEEADEGPISTLDRLTSTGHHIEWMSLVRPELRVSDGSIRRAIHGLAALLESTDGALLTMHYGPISHAIRGACLMHGLEPRDLIRTPTSPGNPLEGRER